MLHDLARRLARLPVTGGPVAGAGSPTGSHRQMEIPWLIADNDAFVLALLGADRRGIRGMPNDLPKFGQSCSNRGKTLPREL